MITKQTDYLFPLATELQKNENTKDAVAMAAYMKDHFKFYGIRSPQMKKISSAFYKKNKMPNEDQFAKIVKQCWAQPEREWQYFGMNLCLKMKKKWRTDHIDLFKHMVITKSWWDSVDFIAGNLVGNFFIIYPQQREKYIQEFNDSNNLWLNRTAILHQLKYKNEVNTKILAECCLKHAASTEFFHRKAIGWALREYSKCNPAWVRNFIERNEFSNLTVREGSKYI